jgi:hypothetical protein
VPETVVDINNSNRTTDFAPTVEWCYEAALVMHPISTNGKLEHWKSHLTGLDEEATILATKVQARMKHFLIVRCPSQLMNHWVWASFTANFVKPVACLAVLANLQSRALEYATTVESHLNNNNSVFPTDSDNEKLDGCYLTLDTARGHLIRSGFAEHGLGRRWKEHLRASHLTDRNTRDRSQYQFYPHESVGDDEAPNRRGTESQLHQKMAMGYEKV